MNRSYLYANDNVFLNIGSRCSFDHNVLLGAANGEIVIGDDVLIRPNMVLLASDHVCASTVAPIHSQCCRPGRIVIGADVWLAANVVVTSGVTIGNGSVVSAGSVATHDLPPMRLCVGNPAQPIHSRLLQTMDL